MQLAINQFKTQVDSLSSKIDGIYLRKTSETCDSPRKNSQRDHEMIMSEFQKNLLSNIGHTNSEMIITKRLTFDVKKSGRKQFFSEARGAIKRICITGGACAGKTTALATIS